MSNKCIECFYSNKDNICINSELCRGYNQFKPKKEMVNHPSHYTQGIEAIDYIESHKMNFNIGNVIKYVTRAKHKGTELQDLKKASWYLNREIERLKKGE